MNHKYPIHPIEIWQIMEDYKVEENQVFMKKINNVFYWFKIIGYELYISTNQITWQPSPNVLHGAMYGTQ